MCCIPLSALRDSTNRSFVSSFFISVVSKLDYITFYQLRVSGNFIGLNKWGRTLLKSISSLHLCEGINYCCFGCLFMRLWALYRWSYFNLCLCWGFLLFYVSTWMRTNHWFWRLLRARTRENSVNVQSK